MLIILVRDLARGFVAKTSCGRPSINLNIAVLNLVLSLVPEDHAASLTRATGHCHVNRKSRCDGRVAPRQHSLSAK